MEIQFEFKCYLSSEEIADPYIVIQDLYINITDIAYLKSDLWELAKAILSDLEFFFKLMYSCVRETKPYGQGGGKR